ncbi:MAG TPA: hypothetical protein VFZ71_03980 [Pyrinomonadaceae bacterium]
MKKIYVITGLLAAFLLPSLTTLAQSQSRKDLLKEIQAKREELIALEKRFLEPAAEDRLLYAEFLRHSNTGLIRLLPREKYDISLHQGTSSRVMIDARSFPRTQTSDLPQGQQVTEDTGIRTADDDVPKRLFEINTPNNTGLGIRGGGAYYSFTAKSHEFGFGSDIQLAQGHLLTGFGGSDYGLMVNLGDVPLENVDLKSPEANVLASYKPASQLEQARLEYRRVAQGTEIGGLEVKSRLPLRSNSTYLLRAMNYRRTDVLVAFRVVRVDSDGSATILWKLLKKYPAPQLARN